MNYKLILICAFLLFLGANKSQSQTTNSSLEKGTMLINGTISFTSQGGDLYVGSGNDRLNTLNITPSIIYFISPNIGIGGDLSLLRRSLGDYSSTIWTFGPRAGLFIETGSSTIPFLSIGVNLLSIGDEEESNTGSRIKFGGGLLFHQDHLAVTVEADLLVDRIKFEGSSESTSGNIFLISVGFGWLRFD